MCAGCHLAHDVTWHVQQCEHAYPSSWEGCKAKVSFSLVLMEFAARGLRMWLAGGCRYF